MVKRVGKYEIGRTLGEGTFGKVKYAVNTETGERVAIKILDKEKIQRQNMGAQIKKEISIMKMVKHDNVVSLYEVLASRTKIFIVLELITGGELFDKIVSEGRFNEEMARYYFRQLIKGVSYCHSQGVCHRDLKPENLLLDEKSSLKISDFGLSALYGGEASDDRMTLLHTTCGTPNYVAPEVLSDKGYDGRAADIWSCGVILYVLLAGFLPFDEPHMSALFRKIQKADFTYPSWFTAEVRGLLDQILVPDPAKRLTLDGVMSHSWFAAGEASPGAAPAEGTASAAAAAEGTLVPTPSKQQMEAAVSEGVDESAAAEAAAADDEPKVGGRNLAELLSTKGGPGSRKAFVTTKSIAEAVEAIAKLLAETGATVEKGEGTVTGAFFQNEGGEATEGAAPLPALGEVKFQVLVHEISEGVRMAEVSKVKGDSLAFHNFFLKVAPEMEKAVEDLVPEEVVAEARARGAGTA